MSVPPALTALAAGLSAPDVADAFTRRRMSRAELSGSREAAVLVLLSSDADPRLVLTERSGVLRKHAGQVAFPGGAIDPGETPEMAALREASEEVGLPGKGVSVMGELPPAQIPVSRFSVHAVVAWWDATHHLAPQDPGEVASVVSVPVSVLADPAHRTLWRHPSGITGPGFDVGDLYVWGFTAFVVDVVLSTGGWATAWEKRTVPIPPRFLPPR